MAGIYIHVPFCVRKCRYCDFYSEEVFPSEEKESNVDTLKIPGTMKMFPDFLCREIDLFKAHYDLNFEIDSIFFGGGTPSLLSPEQINSILGKIRQNFTVNKDVEVTLESNPGTVTLSKLKGYRNAGINRLSLGAQSFVPEELKFLQRIHDAGEIVHAVEDAGKAGFDNINIDLMFAVPGQTKDSVAFTLERTLELDPEHISYYSLIFEPQTPLYKDLQQGKVSKLTEEEDAELYDLTMKMLRDAGYIHYEVSNYAKNEKYKCKHNINYWRGGEYIGFGPSAHGFLGNMRYWNYRDLGKYYELIEKGKLSVEDAEKLNESERLIEIIMLGLRAEGVSPEQLNRIFNFDILQVKSGFVNDMISLGYMQYDGERLSMTDKGYKICDEIILKLVEEI